MKDTWQAVFDQKENHGHRNNNQQQHFHQSHMKSITDNDQSDEDAIGNNQSFSPKDSTKRTAEDNDSQPTIRENQCSSVDLDETVVAQLYAKALDGFVIILSCDGEIVDVSEHVGKYLGIQQVSSAFTDSTSEF